MVVSPKTECLVAEGGPNNFEMFGRHLTSMSGDPKISVVPSPGGGAKNIEIFRCHRLGVGAHQTPAKLDVT